MGMWELPKGWRWTSLDSVVLRTERRNPTKSPDEPFVYVDISTVDNERGAIISPKELQGREAPSRARKVIRNGDVIFATTRPYLRNIALVTDRYDDQICSTGFCVLRANREFVCPLWLYYLCRSEVVLAQVLPRMRGASYPAVTDGDVLASEIPLPPLDEQRLIVAHIEELFARIEEARRLCSVTSQDVERLISAVLEETLPDPENDLPRGWYLKRVAEISEKPQYGYTQSAQDEPVGPKFLRITDIQNGQVNWETVPFCLCTKREIDKYRLMPGDIVFARSGATTGKTFLIRECPEAVFASYLIRLKVRKGTNPTYIYWFFQSPYYWSQIKPRGAAQPNMNARILSGLKVPIPDAPEKQRRIVKYLDGVQAQVTELKRLQEKSSAELERLAQAVLDQAFRGELVIPDVIEVAAQPRQIGKVFIPPSRPALNLPSPKHEINFRRASVMAWVVQQRAQGTEESLNRLKVQKLLYFIDLANDGVLETIYHKKAAGPYSPELKYGGAERVAKKKNWLWIKGSTFRPGRNVNDGTNRAGDYVDLEVAGWVLECFQEADDDELELWATVDYACRELLKEGKPLDVASVREYIASEPEWAPKLERDTFSEERTREAVEGLRLLHFVPGK